MRNAWLAATGASALLLAVAAPGLAGDVNCGIVNKDLQMGRTAQDISERMMISVEDVEKCKAEAKGGEGAAAPAAGEAKGAAEKPAAAAPAADEAPE